MSNYSETLQEQFKQFGDLQMKGLEPMRIFAGLAADTFEQVARKHHEVAGDVVDYAVRQINLPLSGQEPVEVMSAQAAENSAFAEVMSARANEYLELASEFGTKAQQAAEAASASIKA